MKEFLAMENETSRKSCQKEAQNETGFFNEVHRKGNKVINTYFGIDAILNTSESYQVF
jgi:hypothetical protein